MFCEWEYRPFQPGKRSITGRPFVSRKAIGPAENPLTPKASRSRHRLGNNEAIQRPSLTHRTAPASRSADQAAAMRRSGRFRFRDPRPPPLACAPPESSRTPLALAAAQKSGAEPRRAHKGWIITAVPKLVPATRSSFAKLVIGGTCGPGSLSAHSLLCWFSRSPPP